MKMLVTGAGGQLGYEIVRQGRDFGFEISATDLDLDITNREAVESFIIRNQIQIVINSAAYTQVDRAESEPIPAYAVNRDGPANLAKICARQSVPLVHISTDYVFDGEKGSPYAETDPVSPLGVYGRSKEEGERAVREHLNRHIIIRTAWLYGAHGLNFVKTMIRLGQEKETLRVVADQYGSPTCAADLAKACLSAASQIREKSSVPWGTYHYCGEGIVNWHGFTEKILEVAKQYIPIRTREIQAIPTTEYPTPAKRPPYSALNCSKIQANFGIRPVPWQQSLSKTVARIFASEP